MDFFIIIIIVAMAFICEYINSFLGMGYVIINGFAEPNLLILLIAGAHSATPFGPKETARLKEESARRYIGVFMVFLGIITLINIFF